MNWNTIIENWRSFSLFKKVGLGILGIVMLVVLLTVVAYVQMSMGYGRGYSQSGMAIPMMPNTVSISGKSVASYAVAPSVSYGTFESARDEYSGNNFTIAYQGATAVTTKAEDFEQTSYQATIETGDVDRDCKVIQDLKADPSIIFLTSTKEKISCSFSFKVKKDSVEKALLAVKGLDPKQLIENIHTIENTLISYDRRKEILENKLQTITTILNEAVASYEKVSKLAVDTGSVSNLRQAINDKIEIVERLTQKKLAIEQELASIDNSSVTDKDETSYAQFSVYIYRNAYIDSEGLTSSWKAETKRLVQEINNSLQGITLGFLSMLFVALKYVLYLLVIVVVLKYLKQIIVYIWNK